MSCCTLHHSGAIWNDFNEPQPNLSARAQVKVGGLAGMGKRFVSACKRAKAGEAVNQTHINPLDVHTMFETLSPCRLDLLRHVRQHNAGNVRVLAKALGRRYKHVHQDVTILQSAGLLVLEGRKLTAPWDHLQANVPLMAA